MVLSQENWKRNIEKMKTNPYNYMVVDVEILHYGEDTDKLALSINILQFIAFVNFANEFYKKEGIDKKFNPSILYKAIEAIQSERKFSGNEFEEYMNLLKNTDSFFENLQKFSDFYDRIILESEIELRLLGITQEDLIKFSELKLNGCDGFQDNYGGYSLDHTSGKIEFKSFMIKVNRLIKDTFEKKDKLEKRKAA
ncbi:hypothetical protein [Christiangramia sp.]|uniref:hypothetical protein n=1 Tax=Christiangramia sp. TaxID=1931228 RepID=UPI002620ED42|nr:hypothetical protein [Christiangramia sp.]